MDDCIFCKIVAGNAPAHIIAENDNIIVFLSLEGHSLIVPKKHIADIFSLDKETGTYIMNEAIKVSRATKAALNCDGVYITQANGKVAGQDVFHYHMHIYPKWQDARVMPRDEDSRKLTTAKIKSAYDSLNAQG